MRCALLALLGVLAAEAQVPSEPFVLMRFLRHSPRAAGDMGLVRPYHEAGFPLPVFAASSVTGVPETWLIEGHDSFSTIELADRSLLAISRDGQSGAWRESLVGIYRPALSYRPQEAIKVLPRSRYFQISIFRIRPGTDNKFAEMLRLRRFGLDAINVDQPDMTYRIVSGASSPTYVIVTPLPGLKTLDDSLEKRFTLGDPALEGKRELIAETEASTESLIFRIDPLASYVNDEFAAADTPFWRPKN